MKQLDWPLMRNNIQHADKLALMEFLAGEHLPQLTNGPQVRTFEEEFAAWLGCKYAVMVNSGASANLITMAAIREREGPGNVIVPCITWVSDIAAVIHAGLTPVFCDIDLDTLGMSLKKTHFKYVGPIVSVFPTHCLGFDAGVDLPQINIIEDCCEATGATRKGKKLGTFGLASNFSFYYAHHMSTIEGGMVCTDDLEFYQTLRRLRSHGLVREMTHAGLKEAYALANPTLDPEFIFSELGYNVRSTELNAVIGRSQLKRLDANNAKRTDNLLTFLQNLDPTRYRTTYKVEGSSNYALPLILREKNDKLFSSVVALMAAMGVECRRGTAGGGNQLRQPYAKKRWGNLHQEFPNAEHVHCYSAYVGNYPDLEQWKIEELCSELNKL